MNANVRQVDQSKLSTFLRSKPLIILRVLSGADGPIYPDIILHFSKDHHDQVAFGCFAMNRVLAYDAWAPKHFGQLADRGAGYYLFRAGVAIAFHPEDDSTSDNISGGLVLGAALLSLIVWNPKPLAVAGAALDAASQQRNSTSIIAFFEKALAKYSDQFSSEDILPTLKVAKLSPFEILGVTSGASGEEVKAAYREQLSLNHPDKTAHLSKEIQSLAQQRTRAIVAAHAEIVKNRKK